MVAVIALIVFGPDKLPGIARNIGRTANDLRRMANEMRSEFKEGIEVEDEPEDSGPVKRAREHPVARAIRADATTKPAESVSQDAGHETVETKPAESAPEDNGA